MPQQPVACNQLGLLTPEYPESSRDAEGPLAAGRLVVPVAVAVVVACLPGRDKPVPSSDRNREIRLVASHRVPSKADVSPSCPHSAPVRLHLGKWVVLASS